MDEDVTKDDLCGAGKINLEHCGFFSQPNVTIPYNIRLYGEKDSEVSGDLKFTSTLHWSDEYIDDLNFGFWLILRIKIK